VDRRFGAPITSRRANARSTNRRCRKRRPAERIWSQLGPFCRRVPRPRLPRAQKCERVVLRPHGSVVAANRPTPQHRHRRRCCRLRLRRRHRHHRRRTAACQQQQRVRMREAAAAIVRPWTPAARPVRMQWCMTHRSVGAAVVARVSSSQKGGISAGVLRLAGSPTPDRLCVMVRQQIRRVPEQGCRRSRYSVDRARSWGIHIQMQIQNMLVTQCHGKARHSLSRGRRRCSIHPFHTLPRNWAYGGGGGLCAADCRDLGALHR
jgi:hypothetical protein